MEVEGNRKKYSVLVIGAGNIGAMFDKPEDNKILTHAHGFSISPYFQLRGFYDIDNRKAEVAAKRWNTQAFSNLEEALNGIDVVCCCAPDEYHYAVLKEISHYPIKFVIAEKPLTQTMEEAKEIQERYREIPCMINYSRRFIKEFQELKREIRNYGRFLKGNGYYGKGILHNGSHTIDLLCYFFGQIDGYEHPEHGINDYSREDASCDVNLYCGGSIFRMSCIDCSVVTVGEIDLFFEKARIKILDGGMRIEIYLIQESSVFPGYFNYILETVKEVDYSNAILGMVENVRLYLEQGEPLKCCLEDGKKVLDWCLKIRGDLI